MTLETKRLLAAVRLAMRVRSWTWSRDPLARSVALEAEAVRVTLLAMTVRSLL